MSRSLCIDQYKYYYYLHLSAWETRNKSFLPSVDYCIIIKWLLYFDVIKLLNQLFPIPLFRKCVIYLLCYLHNIFNSYLFFVFVCHLIYLFIFLVNNQLFRKFFQEYHQSVKQFESRSGPTFLEELSADDTQTSMSRPTLFLEKHVQLKCQSLVLSSSWQR